MWSTTEVRWFFRLPEPAAIPEPVWRWFRDLPGEFDAQPDRVDHYLRLPKPAALGIKVREGRLELKCRLARPAQTILGPQAAGQIEAWGKWILTDPGEAAAALDQPDLAWWAVTKRRWLRCYRPDREQSFALPPDVEPGCYLELARVQVGDDAWWSLALEVYGRSLTARRTFLEQVAARILSTNQAPELKPAASMSYPRWLELHGPV